MKRQKHPHFDRTGWPLPDEYLLELGRVAALWADLDGYLDLSIGKLAGFASLGDPRPFILIRHSSFPQKLDILSALCESLLSKFNNLRIHKEVVSQLKTAQQSRNRFLHNGMSFNKETGQIQIAVGSARGKVKTSVEVVSVADIETASNEIHEALRSLHLLLTGKRIPPIWERKGA